MESLSRRSTRRFACDYDFLELLREDFGIESRDLEASFIGPPSVPKLAAIGVCSWAESKTENLDERGRMIRAWARKCGLGSYHPAIIGGPELTWGEGV